MRGARIRWSIVGRVALALGALGLAIAIGGTLLEPGDPQPLPPDVGLATGATGEFAYAPAKPKQRASERRPQEPGGHPRERPAPEPERRSPRHEPRPEPRFTEPPPPAEPQPTVPAAPAPPAAPAAPVPAPSPPTTPAPEPAPSVPDPTEVEFGFEYQ
jgi:hypothetical protein